MIETHGTIDFDCCGSGPTIVLVPGSCSTGAAWRPVVGHLRARFRCITTSLPGYGGTSERRTANDVTIDRLAEAAEAVVSRAAAPVHLVGHSFGGLVSLAVALRNHVTVDSLVMLEPPVVTLLSGPGDADAARAFHNVAKSYAAAHARGEREAIAAIIDFYGGAATFASWPDRVRAYAIDTTPVNLVDWQSAYGFCPSSSSLRALGAVALVVCGSGSHPAMLRATERLAGEIGGPARVMLDGASHFMIATHHAEIARVIETHIAGVASG